MKKTVLGCQHWNGIDFGRAVGIEMRFSALKHNILSNAMTLIGSQLTAKPPRPGAQTHSET